MRLRMLTSRGAAAPRAAADSGAPASFETCVRQWGTRLFELIDKAGAPSIFSAKGFYAAMMDWAMKDESFKVQLFRFVDVLPALASSREIARHLEEYLDNDSVKLNPALRVALKASSFASGLLGGGIKSQVAGMARMFMLGNAPAEIVAILKKLDAEGAAFTVDVLGEAVVSEKEADEYAARYFELLALLGRETAAWPAPSAGEAGPSGAQPRVNISLKVSAFYSQICAADPDTAVAVLAGRLRPLLRRARDLGAFINFDMESYALKNLTLRLFQTIFAEPEFASGPECGIALQAYLKDCEEDLRGLAEWARRVKRRVTVRLVKGAYWDYEAVIARRAGVPVPVFERKAESDVNFEKLSLFLLENRDALAAAFASHNVRSIAHALAQAERLGIDRREIEFQVLYGMADAIKAALLQAGCRVRMYCPVGELLPGMAYLVRRLLENTSNEGFLAHAFAKGVARETLLRDPAEAAREAAAAPAVVPPEPVTPGAPGFRNEPPLRLGAAEERDAIRAAFGVLRARSGARHGLVIDGKRVATNDWTPSRNPADQEEIVGYAASAAVEHADAAAAAARAAQQAWARRPVEERARLLERLAESLRRHRAELIALLALEAGKNWAEADAEAAEAIDLCRFHAAAARRLLAPRATQIVPGETNVRLWRPRGVCAVITRWNFPLAAPVAMTTAAVAAGNTAVLKPSDRAPIIASRLLDLLAEAGFPPGVVNLVTGRGAVAGERLAAHPGVDVIAFAGSTETGGCIRAAAARAEPGRESLKTTICAMGGQNALIVDGDADLDEAVAGALGSAFGYSGQKRSALSRLIVVAEGYEKFLERFIAGAASLRVGPAEEPGALIGPVIDREAQRRILDLIEAGRREAVLAWEGAVPAAPKACYAPPAIFVDVPPESRLFREEIFGPVVSVARAKDFEQALALANDSAFALAGGLYSRSPAHIARAKAELACGNLYINRPITGAVVGRQPFGGFRLSGDGTQCGGLDYLQHFMTPQTVTENCLRRGFASHEDARDDETGV